MRAGSARVHVCDKRFFFSDLVLPEVVGPGCNASNARASRSADRLIGPSSFQDMTNQSQEGRGTDVDGAGGVRKRVSRLSACRQYAGLFLPGCSRC